MKQIVKIASKRNFAQSVTRGAQTGAGLGSLAGTGMDLGRIATGKRDDMVGHRTLGGAVAGGIGGGLAGAIGYFKPPKKGGSKVRKALGDVGQGAYEGGVAGGTLGAALGGSALSARSALKRDDKQRVKERAFDGALYGGNMGGIAGSTLGGLHGATKGLRKKASQQKPFVVYHDGSQESKMRAAQDVYMMAEQGIDVAFDHADKLKDPGHVQKHKNRDLHIHYGDGSFAARYSDYKGGQFQHVNVPKGSKYKYHHKHL